METEILDILLPHLTHWGYSIIILMTFLETSAFLGLLVPGESVMVIAGLLASRGILELGDVIWTATLGATMGDTVGYFIGHRLSRQIRIYRCHRGVYFGVCMALTQYRYREYDETDDRDKGINWSPLSFGGPRAYSALEARLSGIRV